MSKNIALIPARGGSKGIPYKNIVSLGGKPLIAHTILAAQAANVFDDICVSSDDKKILAVANDYGVSAINRPLSLAQDNSSTDAVVAEFIQTQALAAEDIIVLLQPTSPLRSAKHITAALKLFKQHPACAVLKSVCAADNKYLYAYLGADPYLEPVAPQYFNISRRQDLPAIYLPNGALYIFTVANFQEAMAIPKIKTIAYEMSAFESIDIDTPADLDVAESYLAQQAWSIN